MYFDIQLYVWIIVPYFPHLIAEDIINFFLSRVGKEFEYEDIISATVKLWKIIKYTKILGKNEEKPC